VLDRIADKWTVLVIGALEDGSRRFSEIQRAIDGISQKMLTQTLRSMEADGLVSRTVFDRVPPAVEYRLTPLGETLKDPLVAICRWAMEHLPELQQARRTAAR
jgi:DNA-binding HxlR family transcriptional regulator